MRRVDKFSYSLENILSLRKREEDKKKREWSARLGDYDYHSQLLEEGKEGYQAMLSSMDQAKRSSIFELRQSLHYQSFLEDELEKRQKKTEEAQAAMEKAQTNLVKARIESRVLDKHKEGAYQRFIKDQEKKEQKMLDELALNQFNHKKGGGDLF